MLPQLPTRSTETSYDNSVKKSINQKYILDNQLIINQGVSLIKYNVLRRFIGKVLRLKVTIFSYQILRDLRKTNGFFIVRRATSA